MIIVEDLPDLPDGAGSLAVRACGESVVVRCDRFLARISLSTGNVDWLVERPPNRHSRSSDGLSRRVDLCGAGELLWINKQTVTELLPSSCGGMVVSARSAAIGAPLWERIIPLPEAAEWAEVAPAWPGAPTEELYGFVADDPERLVVCLTRHTRRSKIFSTNVTVDSLPPFACQTDLVRLDPRTGEPLWEAAFPGVHVGILQRTAFTGLWARSPQLGIIDFETGVNTLLHELTDSLGWPVFDGTEVAVSWHSQDQVGVVWIDLQGRRIREGAWRQRRVNQTCLHRTEAGVGVQTNDQGFHWLGNESRPLWTIAARPYIYRVHRAPGSDVFLGTDGNGGRFLAFDADSGGETLNLKPAVGGVGQLTRIPGHAVLVAPFRVSRSYSVAPQLLVVSMTDRRHRLEPDCRELLGAWDHGVVSRVGENGDRIAVFDLRSPGFA